MSNTKTVMSQAANTQGLPLDITDVFSTYLYTGTGSAQTITNGIDLDGEGGMVWIKGRNAVSNHALVDTERGGSNSIASDTTAAQRTDGAYGLTFNSNGFDSTGGNLNVSGREQASWTFRKAPKFFDVVTYTGDGVAGREIAHNLGSVPGCFILKATSTTGDWIVYHRGLSDPSNKALALHFTFAELDNTYFNDTDPTATHFVVGGQGLGINNTGVTYVAYLFAHNDGDGGFGPSGDQDIIKCGSYTGNGSTTGPEIDLGFEPQWLLVKATSGASAADCVWILVDNMRGLNYASQELFLAPNQSNAENTITGGFDPTATGFKLSGNSIYINGSGYNYIYMAIRRGPLAPPESATEVFDISGQSGSVEPQYDTGFVTDMILHVNGAVTGANDRRVFSRLTGTKGLKTNATSAEFTYNSSVFDYMDGWGDAGGNITNAYGWSWKRAPSFFDVVAYTSNVSSGTPITLNHNLDAVPEMMWFKKRSGAQNWLVYHKDSGYGSGGFLNLNKSNAAAADLNIWDNTDPTETTFTVANFLTTENSDYVGYLFASLDGISKVGSFTTPASGSITVDCGFTSGARFVLTKSVNVSGSWSVFDVERGIVSGNDPYLWLNSTNAQGTSIDAIDPHNSGFIANGDTYFGNNATHIFYAIA